MTVAILLALTSAGKCVPGKKKSSSHILMTREDTTHAGGEQLNSSFKEMNSPDGRYSTGEKGERELTRL